MKLPLALILAASPAFGQETRNMMVQLVCFPYAEVAPSMKEALGADLIARGSLGGGPTLVEIFRKVGGGWMLAFVYDDGTACLAMGGMKWLDVPQGQEG